MIRWWLLALMICTGACAAATPWESYLANPTPQNAARVSVASYGQQEIGKDDTTEDNLKILEAQVIAQDPASVDLAFRLRPSLGAATGEDVDIMLGRLIRTNPKLFLKMLTAHLATSKSIGGLVGNLGAPYVDRWQAQIYETTKRIEALLKIHDKSLKNVRDTCIAELQRQLREEKRAQTSSK